jgi:hypothetical protein
VNDLLPQNSSIILVAALGINENGKIVAIGTRHQGRSMSTLMHTDDEAHSGALHVYLLTPESSR